MVLNWADFASCHPAQRYLATSGDIFSCHNWGVETRVAAKHVIMFRTIPSIKNYLAPNVNSAPGPEVQPLKDDPFTSSLRNIQEHLRNSEPQATSRPMWVIIGLLTRSPSDSYPRWSLRSTGPEQNLSGLWVSAEILIAVLPFGVEVPKFGSNRESMARGRKPEN